jgi:hypothetical protein
MVLLFAALGMDGLPGDAERVADLLLRPSGPARGGHMGCPYSLGQAMQGRYRSQASSRVKLPHRPGPDVRVHGVSLD